MNIGLEQVFRPTILFKHGENGERGKLGGGQFFWRMHQWRQREFKVGGDEPREPTVRLPD